MNKISSFFRLARFDKPIGILLLLWPTMSALWLASNGSPDANIMVIFIIGLLCDERELIVFALDQYVRQDRHGLASFDDPDDGLKGREHVSSLNGELHGFRSPGGNRLAVLMA